MAGVRLHHPTLASCVLVVELQAVYPVAVDCAMCGKLHDRKAVHLRLDSAGDVIVAPEVLAKLQTLPVMAGLEVGNEIEHPPPMRIGAISQPKLEVVEHRLGSGGRRFWRQGKTKYESRDILHRIFRRKDTEDDD